MIRPTSEESVSDATYFSPSAGREDGEDQTANAQTETAKTETAQPEPDRQARAKGSGLWA